MVSFFSIEQLETLFFIQKICTDKEVTQADGIDFSDTIQTWSSYNLNRSTWQEELADGMIIVLDENSVITEIKTLEAAPVEEVVDEEMKKKIAEMEAQIEDMKKGKKAQEVKMAEAEAKFSAAIKELTDVVLQLINTPSAEATEKPKQVFGKVVPSKDSRIDSFLSKYARN